VIKKEKEALRGIFKNLQIIFNKEFESTSHAVIIGGSIRLLRNYLKRR
jgi:hypothetical protein